MRSIYKTTFILGLSVTVLALASCGLFGRKKTTRRGLPKNIAVLPIANKSRDMTAPFVVRYFLEKRLRSKGFKFSHSSEEIDKRLRQMGVTSGNQITESNVRNIGQFLKVDGVVQSTLLEYRQDPTRTGIRKVIRARFRLISTRNGMVMWEKEIEVEGKGSKEIPIRGTLTQERTSRLIRSIARGPAGKLPNKLVKQALKSLRP